MSSLNEIVGLYAQKTEISEEEFLKQQAELPEEEFSKKYRMEEVEPYWDNSRQAYVELHYYSIQARPKDEMHMLMLYDLLKETKKVAAKASILATIAIIGLVAGGLGIILTFISPLGSH